MSLRNNVYISGAKNASTRLVAAALIADDAVTLQNCPTHLVDIIHKINFINSIGTIVQSDHALNTITIDSKSLNLAIAPSYDVPIRTTYLLAAGMLKRFGFARIPYPGGCKLGARGYDIHIALWEKMGCIVNEKEQYIEIVCDKLKQFDFDFPISTIGGTENALICASMIEGMSRLRNAYISPEVQNLIDFLRELGAAIHVVGNSYIEIQGSTKLRGTTFRVMPDRIEALTWMVFAVMAQKRLLIHDVPFEYMEVPMVHLREAGVDLLRNQRNAYICPEAIENDTIQPFELACGTYPGIISDMQPFFVLLALKANGTSRIYDYRYPERTAYLKELAKFCPEDALQWESGVITVKGPVQFKGAVVDSTDLRGSMAVLMAALTATGKSEVHNIEMALRGYNALPEKLGHLGYDLENYI